MRISDTFEQPEMATDLFEHDMKKLNILRQREADSFAKREQALRHCLLAETNRTNTERKQNVVSA
ncbi:MAG: hypothetical protein M5R42_16090 [Rhodocyclaceae bacterium]|nr:hypothetical protein [Rhodocyclaceae bacterium]